MLRNAVTNHHPLLTVSILLYKTEKIIPLNPASWNSFVQSLAYSINSY